MTHHTIRPLVLLAAGTAFAASSGVVAAPLAAEERPSVVSTVSAEQIGGVPDVSLEEALRRLPSWDDTLSGARDYRPRNFAIGGTPTGLGGGDGSSYLSPRLFVGGELQFRYVGNLRDDSGAVDEEFTQGFETHRTKLHFEADLTADLGVRITWNAGSLNNGAPTGESGDGIQFDDAYVGYRVNDNLFLKWGQFKPEFLYEESVGDTRQLLTERSPLAEYFGQQWTEGVQATWEGERIRVAGALFEGFGTWGSAYESSEEADYALGVRFDTRLGKADWWQYGDLTSFRDDDFGVRLGGALVYQSTGDTFSAGAVDDAGRLDFTFDTQIEGGGWSLGGGITGMHIDYDDGPIDDAFSWGANVYGSAFLTDQFEIGARFTALFPDEDVIAGDEDEFYFLEAGFNYYFIPQSHALKFSLDVIYAFDETAGLTTLTNNNGIRPAGPGSFTGLLGSEDDGEFAIRAQVQVLF